MNVQDWQLMQYQSAAREVCYQLGDGPDEMVQVADGLWKERWLLTALSMHQTRLEIEALRNFGHLP